MNDRFSAQRPLVSRSDHTPEERQAVREALMMGLAGLFVVVVSVVILADRPPDEPALTADPSLNE